ncbi:hypothetical protein Tco_0887670 [Tanacetum coccineum]
MGSNGEIIRLAQEAKKQQLFAQKVQQQNTHLTSQIEMYKERVRILEGINKDNNYLNEFLEADERAKRYNKQAQSQLVRDRDIIRDLEKQRDKLKLDVKDHKRQKEEYQKTQTIFKQTQRDKEEKYLNDILQLQAKIKDFENIVCKMGKSTETLQLLTNEQKAFRDNLRKSGLGYNGPYVLSQAYAKIPKLYNAYELCNKSEQLHVFDSEEILEDAVKKLSVEQKYFPSSSIPSVKIPVSKNMPSESPLIKELDKIKVGFEKLSLLIQQNCKRASIFYTSPAEIQINDFCQDQVKPILNELKVYLEFFHNLFQRDIKEMKDVFESTESELNELEKQNELLKDQLLEASLAEDIKNLVITSCVEIRNKDLHDEIDRILKESKDVSNESKTADICLTAKFEAYFEKLEKMKVVLERQLACKVDDSKAEKDQFLKVIRIIENSRENLEKEITAQSLPKNEKDQLLKRIAYLESKLASQDIRSCQKEYHELRTLYNALKVKFDSLNRKRRETNVSKSSKPRESVSAKVHTGESSKPFSRRVSQFTTYSLQKDRKFSKNSQSFETLTPQKGFKKRASA